MRGVKGDIGQGMDMEKDKKNCAKDAAWVVRVDGHAFGLPNTPNSFMSFMHHVLWPYMGKFVVLYFNDIRIYSPLQETHLDHLRLFSKHCKTIVYLSTKGGIS